MSQQNAKGKQVYNIQENFLSTNQSQDNTDIIEGWNGLRKILEKQPRSMSDIYVYIEKQKNKPANMPVLIEKNPKSEIDEQSHENFKGVVEHDRVQSVDVIPKLKNLEKDHRGQTESEKAQEEKKTENLLSDLAIGAKDMNVIISEGNQITPTNESHEPIERLDVEIYSKGEESPRSRRRRLRSERGSPLKKDISNKLQNLFKKKSHEDTVNSKNNGIESEQEPISKVIFFHKKIDPKRPIFRSI